MAYMINFYYLEYSNCLCISAYFFLIAPNAIFSIMGFPFSHVLRNFCPIAFTKLHHGFLLKNETESLLTCYRVFKTNIKEYPHYLPIKICSPCSRQFPLCLQQGEHLKQFQKVLFVILVLNTTPVDTICNFGSFRKIYTLHCPFFKLIETCTVYNIANMLFPTRSSGINISCNIFVGV